MEWYVIYTKPRWEKRIFREIEKLEIEAYCPVVNEIRQWSDRKKKVESPLFKSYEFVRLYAKERNKVFRAAGVVRFLNWLGKPAAVLDAEIETLKRWLDNDKVEEISTGHLSPGEEITVADGDFKGQKAVIKGQKFFQYCHSEQSEESQRSTNHVSKIQPLNLEPWILPMARDSFAIRL